MTSQQIIEAEIVHNVYQQFLERCGGVPTEMNGICAIVAINIYFHIFDCEKADIVGGYLTSSTGWQREHWWIEKDGVVYDPIGDTYKDEPGFRHAVVHRGRWNDFVTEYKKEKEQFFG